MSVRRSGVSSSPLFSDRFNEVVGLVLIAFAVFLGLALWSFHANDPSWVHRVTPDWVVRNYGGTVGAYLAGGLVHLIGSFAVVIPVAVFSWGVTTFSGMRSWWPGWHGFGGLVITLSSAGLFHKTFGEDPLFGQEMLAGGIIGYSVSALLETALGHVGSWVVLLGALMAAVVATTGLSLAQILFLLAKGPQWVAAKVIPWLWRTLTSLGARVVILFRKGVVRLTQKAVSEGQAFWEKLSANWGELSSQAMRKVRVSALDISDGPKLAISSSPDSGKIPAERKGIFSSLGSALTWPTKKHQERPSLREEIRNLSAQEFADQLTEEEARLSLIPGPAKEGAVPEGGERQRLGIRLAGDKGAESFDEPLRFPGKRVSAAPRQESSFERKPRGGIRIGRKRVEEEAPFVAPEVESLEEDVNARSNLHKHRDKAPKGGKDEAHVKVRHAGLEDEADIVRIEDDSLVSELDVPEVMKSGVQRRGRYTLPSLDLFADSQSGSLVVDEEMIRRKSALLEQTLQEFGVEGHVAEVQTGPVITIYEFVPAAGVKVSKISSLSDDLARALSALNVRIVAPIPGTSVVGIEVPNEKRSTVYIKEILSSPDFSQARDKLTLGIGKDILGRTALTDLAKIPHLLIAGATGAGKSVALNMMICSLLVRCMPREVRLVMIDPKMLEFSIYEGIPHLLVPVITSPKKASSALRGVVAEMEGRYSRMSALGVRNIESYNQRVAEHLGARETNRRLSQHLSEVAGKDELDFMPYIVVVIDELADLMMVSSRDVEENMTRLAQMARAAGIHLLVATQRPSVDVLTGLIKANFPSRLSLRVASRTDSRTILDMNGAERLLGKGDMLFIPPGTSMPMRIHGAYVSEKEIRNLVNYWRDQGPTAFQEEIFFEAESQTGGDVAGEDEYDERYDDAVALVARTGEASISLIQRHLRIGYNRAARLIERMEQEGIVGPSDGVKRRQVLIREIPEENAEKARTN